MNKMKKVLATIITMTIICSSYSLTAFAATTEDQTQTTALVKAATPTDTYQTGTDFSEVPADTSTDDANASVDNDKDVTTSNITETKTETKKDDNKKTGTKSTSKKKASYSKSDLRLLSCLIYSESGNQAYSTMLGVANVVLNRVESKAFGHVDTIKKAIYDRKWSVQFAVTIKNKKSGVSPIEKAMKKYDSGNYNASMKKAIKAAKAALSGENNIGSYLCFSNKNYKSYVKKHYSKYRIIDDMIFYRKK